MKASLMLASKSASRQKMLRDAGYIFDSMPANIDEEKIAQGLIEENNLEKIPLVLAQEKAKVVSSKFSDSYVIGSDQVLIIDKKLYSKAKTIEDAKIKLSELQGKTHKLISAVSVYKNNKEVFFHVDEAELTMRDLTAQDINEYCDKARDVLTDCVGCYALESLGVRLFQEIKGDYFMILGMPLLPLVNFLDKEGFKL